MKINKFYLALAIIFGLTSLFVTIYLVTCVNGGFSILGFPIGLGVAVLLDKAGLI